MASSLEPAGSLTAPVDGIVEPGVAQVGRYVTGGQAAPMTWVLRGDYSCRCDTVLLDSMRSGCLMRRVLPAGKQHAGGGLLRLPLGLRQAGLGQCIHVEFVLWTLSGLHACLLTPADERNPCSCPVCTCPAVVGCHHRCCTNMH